METKFLELKKDPEGAIAEAAGLIAAGEVVAFPTETVYGLGADGLQAEAVAKIFAAKGRPADNPLILHIADPEQIHALTTGLNANARALMETFWPGPLTIVVPRSSVVPDIVTAGLDTVAVRMPSHPVAAALIRAAGCPIAAPSANVSGKPSPTNAKDVAEDMTGKVAAILDGGSCGIGVESTVVDTTSPVPTILRPGAHHFAARGDYPGNAGGSAGGCGDRSGSQRRSGPASQGAGHEVPSLCAQSAFVSV